MIKQDILFIVNPHSGRDRHKSRLDEAINDHLDIQKFNLVVEYTQRANHAAILVEEYLLKGFKEFVAVGGDGTINEIASKLLYTDANLNIISKGSGNGLARHLGIYGNEQEAIQRINQGTIKEIDAGSINGHFFLCTAGLGFDAFSANKFNKTPGRGLRNYIKVGLQSYFNYKPISLTLDKKPFTIFSLTVGNASQFGNNAYITPRAEVDNGFLDCCIVNEHPRKEAFKLLRQLFNKKIEESKFVNYLRDEAFEIKTEEPALIHYDGESLQLETTELKIKVLPKALKIRI